MSIFKKPIIELHISNIYKREEFRHKSLISDVANGVIFGLGSDGYILDIISMKKLLKNEGFYINNIIKDYAKNDRCIISTKIR